MLMAADHCQGVALVLCSFRKPANLLAMPLSESSFLLPDEIQVLHQGQERPANERQTDE